MNTIVSRITLDVSAPGSQATVFCRAGDSGSRQIAISLCNGGQPYIIQGQVSAQFKAKKPDGTVIYNACEIRNNCIFYDVTAQTVAVAGDLDCEVSLIDSKANQLVSPRFTLSVRANAYSDALVTSGDEFSALTGALAKIMIAGIKKAEISGGRLIITALDGTETDVGAVAGKDGNSATVRVGSVTTGQPGTSASVTNSGTASAAVLDFVIPAGSKGDQGQTGSTGPAGATGAPGTAATVQVGSVTTGQPGTSASVTNSGTASAAVLDFVIPRGAAGPKGDSGAGTGDMLVSVYDPTGVSADAFDYTNMKNRPAIPAAGAESPKADGTASPGSASGYSRSDHVHPTDVTRLATDGDAQNLSVTFSVAEERTAPVSGEKLSVISGKVLKLFQDLKTVAFSGKTSDLTNDSLVAQSSTVKSFSAGTEDLTAGTSALATGAVYIVYE